jgi:transcriptional regulator with XRE-family HTH domain
METPHPKTIRWPSLDAAMKKKGMDVDALAVSIGVTPRTVACYLTGEFTPTAQRLRRIVAQLSGGRPGDEKFTAMLTLLVGDQPAQTLRAARSQGVFVRTASN